MQTATENEKTSLETLGRTLKRLERCLACYEGICDDPTVIWGDGEAGQRHAILRSDLFQLASGFRYLLDEKLKPKGNKEADTTLVQIVADLETLHEATVDSPLIHAAYGNALHIVNRAIE